MTQVHRRFHLAILFSLSALLYSGPVASHADNVGVFSPRERLATVDFSVFSRAFVATNSTVTAPTAAEVPVKAADATFLSSDLQVLCRLKGEVRTIRIEERKSGGCQTIYAKGGTDQVVASSQRRQVCESVKGNVRGNLTEAGWGCREVQSSQSTSGAGH